MKTQFIRSVSAGFLCLCALTALSGCSLFDFEKLVKESQRKQDEKWRQFIEAQQQLHLKKQQNVQQQPRLEQEQPSATRSRPQNIIAGSVLELAEKAMNEFRLRNDIVMVMFVTQGDVSATLSKVKETMHSYDKHSVTNPYWVVGFPGEATDMETHCGVVVGQWYGDGGGFPSRAPWERIMDGVLARETTSGTYLYSHKGEFRLTEDGHSQMDALQDICFAGSGLAQSDFNSFGAGAGQNGPNLSRPMQPLRPASLLEGQTTTKDLAAMKFKGDTFVGNACSKTVGLELTISDVFLNDPKEQNDPFFQVRGSMEVTLTSQTSLPIPLVGTLLRTGGVLNFVPSTGDSHPRYKNAILSLFRDDEGIGWQGMIEGVGDKGCDDVRITSKNETRLNAFPKMTGDLAFSASHPEIFSNSPLYPLYWLKVAEARGSTDAIYYLGALYEHRGVNSRDDYVLALQYYQAAANIKDDARAQAALGRLYRKGLGTAPDGAKAKQWSGLAKKTRQSAARVCASPKLRDAITRYSKRSSYGWNKNVIAFAAVERLTGLHMKADLGEVTIGKVTAEEVTSLAVPFLCRATGGFDNPEVDFKMPEDESAPVSGPLASLFTKQLMKHGFINTRLYFTLKLASLGNGRYNVMRQGATGIESEVLDLN